MDKVDMKTYSLLAKLYNMSSDLYKHEKDSNKAKEYLKVLQDSYNLLEQIKPTKEIKQENKKQHGEYYHVGIYSPLTPDYQHFGQFISCDDNHGVAITGVRNNSEPKFYTFKNQIFDYSRNDLYIYVEKIGDKLYDVVTGEEYLNKDLVDKNIKQVRWKGKYIYISEDCLQEKLIVFLAGYPVSSMELADDLRNLTPENVKNYRMKIEEIKKIIFNGIREFYAEKQEFENSHISDDEFIKRFKKDYNQDYEVKKYY